MQASFRRCRGSVYFLKTVGSTISVSSVLPSAKSFWATSITTLKLTEANKDTAAVRFINKESGSLG